MAHIVAGFADHGSCGRAMHAWQVNATEHALYQPRTWEDYFSNWWVLCGTLTVGTAILRENLVHRLCQTSRAQIKTRPNWLGEVLRRPWKKMITVACPSGPGCLLDFLGGRFKASGLGRAVGFQVSGFRFEVKGLACIYPDNLGSDFREISAGGGLFFGQVWLLCHVLSRLLFLQRIPAEVPYRRHHHQQQRQQQLQFNCNNRPDTDTNILSIAAAASTDTATVSMGLCCCCHLYHHHVLAKELQLVSERAAGAK